MPPTMTVPLALALLAVWAAPGYLALRRFTPELTRLEATAFGVPLGVVVASLALLAIAWHFGLSPVCLVAVSLVCVVACLAIARSARPRDSDSTRASSAAPSTSGIVAAVVLGAIVLRWALLWSRALTVDADGLSTAFGNLWADWAQHLGDVSSFAYGENFPPVHPRFVEHGFTYHYLTSVTVAATVRLGLSPIVALPLHSFVFSVALLLALYAFARRVLGGPGRAAFAIVLFLLGGGWGWWLSIRAALSSGAGVGGLFAHPWDGAAQEAANFRWQNLYFSLIAPQRAYLYGLPLGLLALRLLWSGIESGRISRFAFAGVVAGLLPLAHQGTLLSLALITPFLFLLFPSRRWFAFFGLWALVGVPQVLPMLAEPGPLRAFRYHLGWIASPDSWVWFWLKNLGLLLPLAVVGLLWRDTLAPPARRFVWALMPAFVIANLFVFQPWDWDNTKILTFWFLGIAMLAAAVLARAWETWRGTLARGVLALAVVTMLLSGVLLNVSEALGRDRRVLVTSEGIELARAIRERTPPHALFAVSMRHNDPVPVLSGRRILVGYPGWLWSQGMAYQELERALRTMLTLDKGAEREFARWGVDYVVIGPEERESFGARDEAFAARYPCVIRTANDRVYAISARAQRAERSPR